MKKAKEHIIFPLDVESLQDAMHYVQLLTGHVGMFKVGLELFIRTGPEIIHRIHDAGSTEIFLDLKLHDIPVTVLRAVKSIADLNVALATVHCGENAEMLSAAVEGSDGKVGILGVTVLTSVSGDDVLNAGFRPEFASDLSELVMKRAAMAKTAGCAGIVCSGQEAERVKSAFGQDFVTVTPGVRPLWSQVGKDDQHRVTTPSEAIRKGADYLVIGRPIRDAEDPAGAAERIAEEIEPLLS